MVHHCSSAFFNQSIGVKAHWQSSDVARNDDRFELWSRYCLPAFSALFRGTGSYTIEEQESHTPFFRGTFAQVIGPEPNTNSLLTYHGSAFELSINFSDSSEPCLRFTFDLPGDQLGHGSGPLPEEDLFSVLPGISSALQADMRWLSHFAKSWFLSEEETAAVGQKLPQCFLAMDLYGGAKPLKAYFFLTTKSILTGLRAP
ncbi:TdiB protein [Seiridium cupressi]